MLEVSTFEQVTLENRLWMILEKIMVSTFMQVALENRLQMNYVGKYRQHWPGLSERKNWLSLNEMHTLVKYAQ